MATVDELKLALVEADRKGDKRAAQLIAEKIKGMAAPSAGEDKVGTLEAGLTIGSSILAEPLSGLAGIGAMLPGGRTPAEAVQQTRESLTYQPRTQAGQEALGTVAETLAPIGEAFQSTEQFLGDAGFELGEAFGLDDENKALLATVLHSAPTAALELLGVAGGKGLLKTEKGMQMAKEAENIIEQTKQQTKTIPQKVADTFTQQSKTKQEIGKLLLEDPANKKTAGYMLKNPEKYGLDAGESIPIASATEELAMDIQAGAPKIVKDVGARRAIKAGFDEGVIAPVSAATKKGKQKMLEMVRAAKRLDENKLEGITGRRYSDIAGDSLKERVSHVLNVNREAGKAIDQEARLLKGVSVDANPIIDNFYNDLADTLGVNITDDLMPDFTGSSIEGLKTAENTVKNVMNRVKRIADNPTADQLHDLKRFIDENVTYGKTSGDGALSARTEGVLKGLRRSADDLLDSNFDSYRAANEVYSETIGAIDDLQSSVGRTINLSGDNAEKALGTRLRALMSNQQQRVNMMNAINDIDALAKKHGLDVDDSFFTQVLFVDELERMFGAQARTSLKGDTEAAIKTGASAIDSPVRTAVDVGAKALGKAEKAKERMKSFDAIENYLTELVER